jgi:hypothetical protein
MDNKMRIFYLIVIGAVLLCSCQNQPKTESATEFYQEFNLGEIVEKINTPQLQSEGGGGGSTTSSGETIEYRRNFTIVYHVKERDGEGFDDKKFLNELRFEIENKMGGAGIRVYGKGSGDSSFYYNYSKDKNKGWLEVFGARLDGNRYKLWCVMREEVVRKDD